MCVVKTPKVSSAAGQEKPVQVFTNRYFVDRGADAVAARAGRNALRIDKKSVSPSAPPVAILPPNQPLKPGIQQIASTGPQGPTIRGGSGPLARDGMSYRSLQVAR